MEENPLCPFGDVLVKARKDRDIMQYRLAKLTKRSAPVYQHVGAQRA